jgi:hypothetical protein
VPKPPINLDKWSVNKHHLHYFWRYSFPHQTVLQMHCVLHVRIMSDLVAVLNSVVPDAVTSQIRSLNVNPVCPPCFIIWCSLVLHFMPWPSIREGLSVLLRCLFLVWRIVLPSLGISVNHLWHWTNWTVSYHENIKCRSQWPRGLTNVFARSNTGVVG